MPSQHNPQPATRNLQPLQARTLDYTRAEYLAIDEAAPEGRRWEYDGLRVYAMAGASPEHNQLAGNIHTALNNRLQSPGCRVMQADQRVQCVRRYVYPDVVAFCEEGRYTGEHPPSLLNPELVVEVLSSSTMEKDLTWKLSAYRQAESVREVWIAWTSIVRIDQYAREGDGWRLRSLEGKEAVLRSEAFAGANAPLEIPVEEIYALVL